MNENRRWYGLNYTPHDKGSVWADQSTEYRPKAGLPAARLFVFPSREARDAWIGEERPNRVSGRYHRDVCDASTARSMMIDAIRLDRLTAGRPTSSYERPTGELVDEYLRIHPDRMIPDPTAAPAADPADETAARLSGGGDPGDGELCSIRWVEDDLRSWLADHDYPVTDANLQAMRDMVDPKKLCEAGIEAGWWAIDAMIDERRLATDDNGRDADALSCDPADPVNLSMTGADTSSMGVAL